jgi:carboxyl-terminal processing protease
LRPSNNDIEELDKKIPENYKILQPLMLAACVAIGMMFGYKMNENIESPLFSTADTPSNNPQLVGRVEELLRFVENKYVDTVDSQALVDEAVTAMMDKLDPHSSYLSPLEVKEVEEEMNGRYYGIGIENFYIDDTVCVFRVLPDSPSAKAGLKPFDRIISINDTIVAGKKMTFESIRSKLRQKAGMKIKLNVLRQKQMVSLTAAVGEIPVRTVHATIIPEAKAALIKIDRFGHKTYAEFMEEIEKNFADVKGGGPKDAAKHLIIDLRDNPGGFLPEATNILCQLFAEKDQLLVFTEGKSNKKNEYKTTGKRFFDIDKVVVLIDENSASASEIIAGAIQDWDRGTIVGRRSYGKGLVQEQYDLNNGGAIRLTVARYYTPSGRSIQRPYDDKEKYYRDNDDRLKNGDLFHKDSTIVKGAKDFKTLVMGRKVQSVGGISPDVFVGMDTIYRNEQFGTLKSYIPEFLCKYVSSNPRGLPANGSQISTWSTPKDFYPMMIKYVSKKEGAVYNVPMSKMAFLDRDIKYALAHVYLDTKAAQQLMSAGDPFVTNAVEIIKSNRVLK